MHRLCVFIGLIWLSLSTTQAQTEKVQAGFIYHFTNYVEWPAAMKSGSFVIGIVGDAPIKGHLEALAKVKKAGTQTIVVKKLSSGSQASGCHIVYLPKGKSGEFASAQSSAKAAKALLVTEKPGLGKKGSGVNFILKDGRQKFELNKSAIQGNGLKVSPKLEALAIVVG